MLGEEENLTLECIMMQMWKILFWVTKISKVILLIVSWQRDVDGAKKVELSCAGIADSVQRTHAILQANKMNCICETNLKGIVNTSDAVT